MLYLESDQHRNRIKCVSIMQRQRTMEKGIPLFLIYVLLFHVRAIPFEILSGGRIQTHSGPLKLQNMVTKVSEEFCGRQTIFCRFLVLETITLCFIHGTTF